MQKTVVDSVETFMNQTYASFIHTSSLTDNFQKLEKEREKKEKKLTLNE